MAFKIKPEDVPKNFVYGVLERARKTRVDIELGKQHEAEDEIAEFLNAAIEAGLVSPPCHVHRYLGEIECQGGTLDPALFIGKPKEEGDEHWKGQSE